MSAVIAWIIKVVAGWCGGNVAKATSIVGWGGFAVAVGASAIISGGLVHTYDAARHDAVIAEIRATSAETLQVETAKVLNLERAAAVQTQFLEDAYAQLADTREAAAVDSARLSGDLHAALERLRRIGSSNGGSGRMPTTAIRVDGCADLRTARDRAIAALEYLQAAGDQAALDGQRGVDVATIAARAAAAKTENQ